MISLRTFLIGLAASSGLCWFAWILTLVNTNPGQGGQTAILSFYISLFFALLGTLTLLGYGLRLYFGRNEIRYAHMRTAFRQAFLAATLVVMGLLLLSVRLLSWWDILLLVAVTVLVELYLKSNARS